MFYGALLLSSMILFVKYRYIADPTDRFIP